MEKGEESEGKREKERKNPHSFLTGSVLRKFSKTTSDSTWRRKEAEDLFPARPNKLGKILKEDQGKSRTRDLL